MDHWWERAACRGENRVDVTLPNMTRDKRRAVARWYCIGCTVKPQCAADARRHNDTDVVRAGIWLGSNRSTPHPRVSRALEAIAAGGTDE